MAHQESAMTTKELLCEEIENILKTDVDFLLKLAPREMAILAASLKDSVAREKKHSLNNYHLDSIDLDLKTELNWSLSK